MLRINLIPLKSNSSPLMVCTKASAAAAMTGCNLGHTENTSLCVYYVCICDVISANTHTHTQSRSRHTRIHYSNQETNIVRTLSAYWWQVLVLNLVVTSVSLITGAADGGNWGSECVLIQDEGRKQTMCSIKAWRFVGKAEWSKCIVKCEVMRRVSNPVRQSISKCESTQTLTCNVTCRLTTMNRKMLVTHRISNLINI